jgi:streptogramin lyase
MTKPGAPTGILDIEPDRDGNLWLGMMLQGAIVKFDRKTRQIATYKLPPALDKPTSQQAMVMPIQAHLDGKVWLNDVGIPGVHRLDLASGAFETWMPYKDLPKDVEHTVYGIKADSQNNLFFLDFSDRNIGRIDAKTGKVALFPTPTADSRPRRGFMDTQDRLWFTEWGVDRLAMLDTRTDRFSEWKVPTEWTAPYDVMPDRNGELWSGGMQSDRVLRLDPATGHSVEYLLPHVTNIRRVFVDNATNPVTFWTGNNQGAAIVKLEPLD